MGDDWNTRMLRRAMLKRYTIWNGEGKVATAVDFETAHEILAEQLEHDRPSKWIALLRETSYNGAIKYGAINIVACGSWHRHQRQIEIEEHGQEQLNGA
jgi:hypothetical protein